MEENRILVLDASVIIKWLGKETENLSEAKYLRDLWNKKVFEIAVPAHFMAEVMNIICRDYPEKASSFFSLLNLGGIVTHSLNLQTLILSLDLTGKYKHISFYDAFYHALAISKNTSFVTSDKKYYDKVKKEGHIVLLENIHNLL